jgi:deoxyguanosine kinase
MTIPYKYIVIEGTIGAGKTSLAKMLTEELNGLLILEQFEENSFLPKFYENPDKYAFPLELSFLASRYQQLKDQLMPDLFGQIKIADYFIDKCIIFSRKTLGTDEFVLFRKLFSIIISQLPQPELLVYLYKSPEHLKRNIQLRGRDYEKGISMEYLNGIQQSYMEYIQQKSLPKVVIVDTSYIDFVHNHEDYIKMRDIVFHQYNDGIHSVSL